MGTQKDAILRALCRVASLPHSSTATERQVKFLKELNYWGFDVHKKPKRGEVIQIKS